MSRAGRRPGVSGVGWFLVVAATLAVAGCAPGVVHRSSPPMMGGAADRYDVQSRCAPGTLPGQVVTVMLSDMGAAGAPGGYPPAGRMMAGMGRMMMRAVPTTVPAGQVSFVVRNMGWRTHELVVLPLGAAAAAGQREPGQDGRVDETGSLGEASASCAAGAGDGIAAGAGGWVTLTLPPGRYELICNLPGHYAAGMYQLLTVSG